MKCTLSHGRSVFHRHSYIPVYYCFGTQTYTTFCDGKNQLKIFPVFLSLSSSLNWNENNLLEGFDITTFILIFLSFSSKCVYMEDILSGRIQNLCILSHLISRDDTV